MSLEENINGQIKAAMLSKDAARLEALRAVKSAILLLKTGEGATPENELKALQKMVKHRKETAQLYTSQGREDLASVELFQAAVIEEFLPQQMSREALMAEINAIIAQVGAAGPQDLGKVMGVASKALAGKADGKAISEVVKELLTK
jgi:uncharacterized protein YqeY